MNCDPQDREMQALARKFQADIAIGRTGNIARIRTARNAPVSPARVTNPA
jgi:hypothetical protein